MKFPLNIWVVYGETGEYSDRCEWTVCGYTTEEKAKEHSINAQKVADDLRKIYKNTHIPSKANPYDLTMSMDYNGTRYGYYLLIVNE